MLGGPSATAVSSGTAALRVVLAALGIGPGDEVITSAFTFVATVEAIIESGATPVICEIDETLNLCVTDLRACVTSRTKAVIAVHMLGNPANMPGILAVSEQYGIQVIEDVAWGCGATLNNQPLGTWGVASAFSFDHAKLITTGEGGMAVSTDPAIGERIAAWHDHGHLNVAGVPRWKDSRQSSGFNFRMTELQGAIGAAQLSKISQILRGQRMNAREMASHLLDSSLPAVVRPEVDGSDSSCDAFVFAVQSEKIALSCRNSLLARGVGTKILPEALSWHFAGRWEHLVGESKEIAVRGKGWKRSEDILKRQVAIPVSAIIGNSHPKLLVAAIAEALR